MSNDEKFDKEGIRVGDFHIRPTPVIGTSDRLDTPESRERARNEEDDAEAARRNVGDATGELSLAEAREAVDASIEEARARVDGATVVPILLRDPLTGKVVGEL
jgi:hypothetical protein